jgi:hypothetical protein
MSGSLLRHWPTAAFRSTAIPRWLPIAIAAACAAGLPLVLFYRLILFHFYERGGFLLDTGLLASLMWHCPIWQPLPASLGGASFFATHVAPILSLVSVISDVLPLSLPQTFAGFTGVSHALLAAAAFWLLVAGYGMRRGWRLALAALASAAFAFNGLALSIVRMPHFEMFGAACLILFFCALVLRRRGLAIVWFLLALATREDVGLHAFGFLTVWIAYDWWQGVPWCRIRLLAAFAAVALAYSVVVLLLQHWAFPASSSFGRIYLGSPPFAHLSAHLVAVRLAAWMTTFHTAILLPAVATAWWAARIRDPSPLLGYVACLPWAVLHLLAISGLAGLMAGYYAYPFLVAMVWPWVIGVDRGYRHAPVWRGAWPAGALAALVAMSVLVPEHEWNPGRIELPQAFLQAPSAEQQRRTDRAIAAIAAARPELGQLMVDESVAGLAPRLFAHAEIAEWEQAPPDTVVYLEEGFDAARERAIAGLPDHAAIPGTMLRIRTNRAVQVLRRFDILP